MENNTTYDSGYQKILFIFGYFAFFIGIVALIGNIFIIIVLKSDIEILSTLV